MSFFEELKGTLKDKWLEYYKTNRSWIDSLEENESSSADGGTRPSSSFILGAISLLEPGIRELLIPCCALNPNQDKLIEVLGLDFDPDKELEKKSTEKPPNKVPEADFVRMLPDNDDLNKIIEDNLK